MNKRKSRVHQLESQLRHSADAWAGEYARNANTTNVESSPRPSVSTNKTVGSNHSGSWRHRHTLSLSVIASVLVLALGSYLYVTPSHTVPIDAANRQRPSIERSPQPVNLKPLLASFNAIEQIWSDVHSSAQNHLSNARWQQSLELSQVAEASIHTAAETIPLPGKRYGQTLAWLDRRMDQLKPSTLMQQNFFPNNPILNSN